MRHDPISSLRALLDREFGESIACDPGLAALPRHLLDPVLLDPALEFLGRPGKAFRWHLVEIGWRLGGATGPVPLELPLAVEILHAGSLIVDDIQDGSSWRRGGPAVHEAIGLPLALNLANWMYFWPFTLIEDLRLPARRELEVRRRMTQCLSQGHVGQALDIGVRVFEADQKEIPALVRAISELKTGRLMQLAASLGPVAAGMPPDRVAALERFGRALGLGLQMLDDLGNLVGRQDPTKRHEDLRLGRPTWVWSRLAERLEPGCFRELQRQARCVAEDAADAEPLALRLREQLDAGARAEVSAHLDTALQDLQACLGPEAKLDDLREEIARLESSYV